MNQSIYIAVTGTQHYYGADFLKPGQIVHLIKDPDNPHDHEAIKVEMTAIGKIGYVANSPHTVPKGCQYVLGIRVKDQVIFDRTSWLKPNERGSLLHEVYRRYMTEVSASKVMPITHDHARLLRIAEETILLYAERIPAPSLWIRR